MIMTFMYDNVHICTYSMQLEVPGGYLCPRWYIIAFQMDLDSLDKPLAGLEGVRTSLAQALPEILPNLASHLLHFCKDLITQLCLSAKFILNL